MTEEPIFHCARCGEERPLEKLPRATLAVCAGVTTNPWSQLLCESCIREAINMLHKVFCPRDIEDGFVICGEEHHYEL